MQVQLRRGDISEIARRANLPRQTVSDVVSGRTRNPGVHTARAIEDAISQLETERAKASSKVRVSLPMTPRTSKAVR